MSRPLLFVVSLALMFAVACSGSSPSEDAAINEGPTLEVTDGVIILPQPAITELARGYRFTTDLDLSTTEEELTVHFEGESQAPDKIQGTMQVSAAPYSELGDFGLIVVGDHMWWNLDGEWQSVEQDGDTVHPLMLFNYYATPRFYLEALRYDLLALSVVGPAEMANGVESFAVQLDRQTIVQVMDQSTEFKRYPDAREAYLPGAQGIRRNLNEFLPANFVVEVWFAKKGGSPTRIVISYDITEEDPTHLSFGLGDLLSIRLQMDITDADPTIQIDAPEVAESDDE